MGMAFYRYAGIFKRKCRLYGKSTSKEFWSDFGSLFEGAGHIAFDIFSCGISVGVRGIVAGVELSIDVT